MRLSLLTKARLQAWPAIKSFYDQYVTYDIRLIYALILLLMVLSGLLISMNALVTHYSRASYVPIEWVRLSPVVFVVLLLGLYAQDKCPRLAFFTRSYCTYFFILFVLAAMSVGVQYTPFPRIDAFLLHADQALGFSTQAVIAWTGQHAAIKKALEVIYELLSIELFVIPLLLPFMKSKRATNELFVGVLLSIVIGFTIYYFFPTAAPTSVLHSSYFLPDQHKTYLKFYEIHHYQKVTTEEGGLIAFPSFHVIWAILLNYVLWTKKPIFIVVALINMVIICSTVLLGWHYLLDVFAGIVVAILSIVLARWLLLKC